MFVIFAEQRLIKSKIRWTICIGELCIQLSLSISGEVELTVQMYLTASNRIAIGRERYKCPRLYLVWGGVRLTPSSMARYTYPPHCPFTIVCTAGQVIVMQHNWESDQENLL